MLEIGGIDMEMVLQKSKNGNMVAVQNRIESSNFHFERPRLNQLFKEAAKYPLTIVCAGAGYGKTCAVRDFI